MTEWTLAVTGYWAVMVITPGPNNLLLANSGLAYGLRRTVPMIAGIQAGVLVQNLATGAGLGAVFVQEPAVQTALKVIGSAYILYLAVHAWLKATSPAAVRRDAPGFLAAAGFQFVNPKSWISVLVSTSAFLEPATFNPGYVLLLAGIAGLVGVLGNVVWATFGAGLRRQLSRPAVLARVQRALSVLLAATVALFWLPNG